MNDRMTYGDLADIRVRTHNVNTRQTHLPPVFNSGGAWLRFDPLQSISGDQGRVSDWDV